MKELIELIRIVESKKEKAMSEYLEAAENNLIAVTNILDIRISAFSDVINECILILNNSVVKPSERRSPTDESFNGCKPPDERQNPQEKILACTCIYRTEKDKKIKIGTCEYCKQEFLNLLKGWK